MLCGEGVNAFAAPHCARFRDCQHHRSSSPRVQLGHSLSALPIQPWLPTPSYWGREMCDAMDFCYRVSHAMAVGDPGNFGPSGRGCP